MSQHKAQFSYTNKVIQKLKLAFAYEFIVEPQKNLVVVTATIDDQSPLWTKRNNQQK
jgi:hypothetical protein